mgnify:CR=1 FL=1|jgi:hypothetical protein
MVDIHNINEDKLPIKYVLGIQEQLEAFPDAFDILYIFINAAIRRPDRQKETFTQHALLKYYSKGNTENAMEGLKKAIQLGLIEQIKEEPGKETYEIKINPFI